MKKILLFVFLYSPFLLAQSGDLGFKLNGTSDYILVPDTDAININVVSNRTIEFWFKITSTSRRQVIYEEGDHVKAIMYYVEGGFLYLGSYTGSNTYFFRKPIIADTWYHVSWTLDNAYIRWYLNGVLQDEMAASTIPAHPGDINLGRSDGRLGYVNTTATWTNRGLSQYSINSPITDSYKNFFGGNIGLFRIWSVPRTITQITASMNTIITDVITNPTLLAYLYDDSLVFLQSNGNYAVVSNANLTEKTWSPNATNTNILQVSNWVGEVLPDYHKLPKIIIPLSNTGNYPNYTTSVRMGKLEVQAGARLTIAPDVVVQLIYEAKNYGTILIENNGSFILRDNEDVIGTGNFEVRRNSPAYTNKSYYSYWSSPLKEASSNPTNIFTGSPIIYRYNAQMNPSDWVANNGANLKQGIGYAVRAESIGSKVRTFFGKVNNGDVEIELYKTPSKNNLAEIGFNLIGNPYPSAINFGDFVNDPTNEILEKNVWFWNHQNILQNGSNIESDYYVYNALSKVGVPSTVNENIGTAQGFLVKIADNKSAGTVVFKNHMRVAADAKNKQFYRTETPIDDYNGKIWLNLKKDNKVNTLYIGFLRGATMKDDDPYDAVYNNSKQILGFYTLQHEKKYTILNNSELWKNEESVALGINVAAIGNYEIAIDKEQINPKYKIELIDNQTNTITNLRNTSYQFNATKKGEDNQRFSIRFTNLNPVDPDKMVFNLMINFEGEVLKSSIHPEIDAESIAIYDFKGSLVRNYPYANQIQINGLKEGIYIISVLLENGRRIQKKLVKINP